MSWKKVEIKIKQVLHSFAIERRKTYRLTEVHNCFYFGERPRILLLRHDRIGDLLISTPVFRILSEYLRKNYPKCEIDVLLSEKNITAKRCVEDYVDNIFVYQKSLNKAVKLIRTLRKRKYNLAIDLLENFSTTGGILIKYISPIFVLGLNKPHSEIYDYTVPALDKRKDNIVERTAQILMAFGINPNESSLNLWKPLDTPVNKIYKYGINIAGSTPTRSISEETLLAIITHLKTASIRLFYMAEEQETAERLKSKFPNIHIGLCQDFVQYANEVAKCNIIISPDTAVVHLCAAFNIPGVFLYIFNAHSPHLPWYPYNSPYIALHSHTGDLSGISSHEIIQAIEQITNK